MLHGSVCICHNKSKKKSMSDAGMKATSSPSDDARCMLSGLRHTVRHRTSYATQRRASW